MLDQSHVCIPWDATRGKTGEGGAGGAWEWLRKSRNGCSGSCPSHLSDRGKGELADLPSVCSKIPIKTPEHFPDRSKDRAQQLCLSLEKNKKKPKFIHSLFSSLSQAKKNWKTPKPQDLSSHFVGELGMSGRVFGVLEERCTSLHVPIPGSCGISLRSGWKTRNANEMGTIGAVDLVHLRKMSY